MNTDTKNYMNFPGIKIVSNFFFPQYKFGKFVNRHVKMKPVFFPLNYCEISGL